MEEAAGTTDTTPAFLRSFSVVDELELSDSEFDELSPIPETPSSPTGNQDAVDSTDAQGHPGGLPFSQVFSISGSLEKVQENVWMPGVPITVKVTGFERQPALKLLNPNLYTIQVEHGEFKWTVKRRYKHFRQLHDQLSLYRARCRIPLPNKEHQRRRRTFRQERKERVSVKFPMRPEALLPEDRIPRRMNQLETYLQALLKCKSYKNHPETRKFFEVSPLSFIKQLGMKYREGTVKKCSGGRRISIGCCGCLKKFHFAGHWNRRWLILRDTFLAYIRPRDGSVCDVMLMDGEFEVSAGMRDTGAPHGLMVSNLSRNLLVKCWTRRKAREWEDAIRLAAESNCGDFKHTRFEAFAPARDNAFTRWFVDGATYFEAVAEALEKAKEEIYITDWWLSPEIYLKRPITEGDKWRLDLILQRKAEDGVKVFILLYKEVEIALGINSTYTKQSLMQRHENIKVLRHPDHGAAGVLLWAHHEKLVVVDQGIAFLGGLDLCYGRWDNQQHRLTDLGSISYKQPQPARSNISLTPEYSSMTNMTVISDLPSDADVQPEDIASIPSAASPHQVTVTVSPPSPPQAPDPSKTGSDEHLNAAFHHEESEAPGDTKAQIHTHVQRDSSPLRIPVSDQREESPKGDNPVQGEATPGGAGGDEKTAVKGGGGGGDEKSDSVRECREGGDAQQSDSRERLDAGSGKEVTKTSSSPSEAEKDSATASDQTSALDSSLQAAAVAAGSASASSSQAAADVHQSPEAKGGRKHLWGGGGRKKLALIMPKWHSEGQHTSSSSADTPPPPKPATAPAMWHESNSHRYRRRTDHLNVDEVDSRDHDHMEVAAHAQHPLGLTPGKRSSRAGSDSSTSQTSQSDMLPHSEQPDGKARRRKGKERNNNDGSNGSRGSNESLRSAPEQGQGQARRRWKKVFHVQKFESRIQQRQKPEEKIEGFMKLPQTPSSSSHLFRRKQLGQLHDRRNSMDLVTENGKLAAPGFPEIYRTTSELAIQEQGLQGSTKLWIGKDYVNFIHKDFVQLEQPFEDFIDRQKQPRMPWHDIGVMVYGKAARDVARHFIGRWNFTKIEKCKKDKFYPVLLPKTYSKCSVPQGIRQITFQARTQILRSLHAWSGGIRTTEKSIEAAYIHCIDNAKHFIYIENQFFITHVGESPYVFNKIGDALYRRILRAYRSNEKFRVFVVMPLLPAFEGEFGTTQGAALQAVTYWNFNSICRGQHSLLENLAKEVPDPLEYISFCGLRTHSELMGKLVTELIYVHSKLMIVDDKVAIIGSANINDRSMLGRRDSELAIMVEDTQLFPATLNGATVQVGYFASSLRRTLFREHLGLMEGDQGAEVADVVTDHFYKRVWLHAATTNTKIFDEVFRCIPCDDVHTIDEMRAYTSQPGLAEDDPVKARDQLAKVRGYLVLVPLHFLKKEDLAPKGKEGLLPYYLWT